jgi:hypothetical protein
MVTITQSNDVVTLISVFACEPKNQQALIDAWIRATEETLGRLPGIVSATLHKTTDGTRVVNYAQWRTSEDWQELIQVGAASYFTEMGKLATADPHLYEICYQLDKSKDG